MTGLEGNHIPRRHLARGQSSRWIAAGLCALLSFAAAAQAQPAQNSSPESNVPAGPPPPPTGALETIGRWVGDSVSTAGAGINAAWRGTIDGIGGIGGQAGTAAKDAADAATTVGKGAADAATTVGKGAVDAARGAADVAGTAARLPLSRVVSGRERCTIAPNGAPDCRMAADALCKNKGFASGTSVDFENAENCPAQVLLAGKSAEERNCPIEYFVTKSLCQ
jgi:hypothetical protein